MLAADTRHEATELMYAADMKPPNTHTHTQVLPSPSRACTCDPNFHFVFLSWKFQKNEVPKFQEDGFLGRSNFFYF